MSLYSKIAYLFKNDNMVPFLIYYNNKCYRKAK